MQRCKNQSDNGRDRVRDAGARRITRLFKGAREITRSEFVSVFANEYEKRVQRGLAESRAVAEILTNMPQRALFNQMYGNE